MSVIIDYDKPDECEGVHERCIFLDVEEDCILLAMKGKYYEYYDKQYANCPLRKYEEDEDDGK